MVRRSVFLRLVASNASLKERFLQVTSDFLLHKK